MKNKKFTLLFGTILFILVIIFWITYSKNNYDASDYFLDNRPDFEYIVTYIDSNDLNGSIHSSKSDWNTWTLYNECIDKNNCMILEKPLKSILEKLNVEYLTAYLSIPWVDWDISIDNYLQWIHFFLKGSENIKSDMFLYYWKWFYSERKELENFNGSDFNIIHKIYSDDWGLIDWCYQCTAWAWD